MMNRLLARPGSVLALLLTSIAVTGCATLGAAGPGTKAVSNAGGASLAGSEIALVDLDQAAILRVAGLARARNFSEVFGSESADAQVIEPGDMVGVTIWEAPPAVLFGTGGLGSEGDRGMLAQSSAIPDQRVDEDGMIAVPFAGRIRVAGRSPAQVQREIAHRLAGKAHDPQILVRIADKSASNVTVLGKVANTRRVALTPRGERLLDILAAAGGPTESVEKTTIRLTRGARAAIMPLDAIILDPAQNVRLRGDDVVTVIHQPFSFTALGAVQRNAEIPFEGSGLSLAQALGRLGGLRDDRADIKGVFLFRWEDPAALDTTVLATTPAILDGRVPVIYRLDMSNAASLFIAQDFAMRNGDLLYVSTAPGADLQKVLSTVSGVALSTLAIGNSL